MILIAGGAEDPNILRLCECLRAAGAEHRSVLVGPQEHPCAEWLMEERQLILNGEVIRPTGVFVRYDVFSALRDQRKEVSSRALAWFTMLTGYALANEEVVMVNRLASPAMGNKPAILSLAQDVGLKVPRTRISNDLERLKNWSSREPCIVKPIDGGDYCRKLGEVLKVCPAEGGSAAHPAIVQEELIQPEIRIYRIGERFIGFDMESPDLDYRVSQSAKVSVIDQLPERLVEGQRKLMDRLGMEFGAADYKTDPATGEFAFLEVNSGPMFAHFDFVSDGAISRALVDYLSSTGSVCAKVGGAEN